MASHVQSVYVSRWDSSSTQLCWASISLVWHSISAIRRLQYHLLEHSGAERELI